MNILADAYSKPLCIRAVVSSVPVRGRSTIQSGSPQRHAVWCDTAFVVTPRNLKKKKVRLDLFDKLRDCRPPTAVSTQQAASESKLAQYKALNNGVLLSIAVDGPSTSTNQISH